jgi:hypothetical protein
MNSERLDELLACYVLDALDDADRRLVDELLAEDPAPRARLDELERAVVLSAHEIGPPDHVWEALASRAFPGQEPIVAPRLAPFTRRRRVRTRLLIGAAAACVAALVTGLVLTTTASNSAGPHLAAVASASARAPGARQVALHSGDGTEVATAVVLPDGSGYLTSRLGHLGPGRTYQLWGSTGDQTISLGVLGPHPGVVAFTAVGSTSRLLITDEAAPGVPVTHRAPTAVGDLPPA